MLLPSPNLATVLSIHPLIHYIYGLPDIPGMRPEFSELAWSSNLPDACEDRLAFPPIPHPIQNQCTQEEDSRVLPALRIFLQ